MKKPPSPPRRRHLSKEDEALWEHTAASLKPLKTRKPRHLDALPDLDAVAPFEAKGKAAAKSASETRRAATEKIAPPKPVPQAAPPALNAFDRKAARRLRQGQIEIEARVDLHGMRQHEAHGVLRRFLLSASARGLRWVLVITGKGGPQRSRDEEPAGFGTIERGVLRRNVPMWLAEPELRAVVVSFAVAAIPHGGEGALYVQLRKPDRLR
jgi:DNA-nicking Smr family endonuclease